VAGTQYLSSGGRVYLLEGGNHPATAVDLSPLLVSARRTGEGVDVRLENAFSFTHCFVERREESSEGAQAARRFRESIVEAYRGGLLTAEDAIRARSQDPVIRWNRVSSIVAVSGGRASYLDRAAHADRAYTYRFVFVSGSTVLFYSPLAAVNAGAVAPVIPAIRVHPNPARDRVAIEFHLARPRAAELAVYDAAGRRVATLRQQGLLEGDVRFEWDARSSKGEWLANGIYFARLEGADFVAVEKITLLR
jgi:hypothetical protein